MEFQIDFFIANLTLIRLIQGVPGFQVLMSKVRPVWYFRITLWIVVLLSWFAPRMRRRAEIFRAVFKDHYSRSELSARTRSYLFHSRLVRDIEVAWFHWGHRYGDWIALEGECHLRAALQNGAGAVLISPHNYGFSKIVSPVLAMRGYKIHRGGNGGKKAEFRYLRWGTNGDIGWRYLSYKGDYWHRVQLLKTIQRILRANEVVHVSPRSYSQGEPGMSIEVLGRKFYLDVNWFRIIRVCGAPVLPCFAVASAEGQIRIIIHPPMQASDPSLAQEFSKIQTDYISKFPESGRLWKSLHVQRGKW